MSVHIVVEALQAENDTVYNVIHRAFTDRENGLNVKYQNRTGLGFVLSVVVNRQSTNTGTAATVPSLSNIIAEAAAYPGINIGRLGITLCGFHRDETIDLTPVADTVVVVDVDVAHYYHNSSTTNTRTPPIYVASPTDRCVVSFATDKPLSRLSTVYIGYSTPGQSINWPSDELMPNRCRQVNVALHGQPLDLSVIAQLVPPVAICRDDARITTNLSRTIPLLELRRAFRELQRSRFDQSQLALILASNRRRKTTFPPPPELHGMIRDDYKPTTSSQRVCVG